jgi:lipopolysaccharide/colanic/teichoic acid biosynthesis glycosyltransferase
MSAVGPRPHLIVHDNLFAKQLNAYRTRFFVKPGITGLAQSNGWRGEITEPALLQKRIEQDLIYIANWSIWMDLQITVKTIRQVIFPPKSAY